MNTVPAAIKVFFQRDRHHKIHDQLRGTQDGTGRLSVPETRNRAEHLRFSHGKRRGTHEKSAHRLIAIENAIFESWSAEEQQIFIKLNRDFAVKFTEETKTI